MISGCLFCWKHNRKSKLISNPLSLCNRNQTPVKYLPHQKFQLSRSTTWTVRQSYKYIRHSQYELEISSVCFLGQKCSRIFPMRAIWLSGYFRLPGGHQRRRFLWGSRSCYPAWKLRLCTSIPGASNLLPGCLFLLKMMLNSNRFWRMPIDSNADRLDNLYMSGRKLTKIDHWTSWAGTMINQ